MSIKKTVHRPLRRLAILSFAALFLSACSGSDKIDLSSNKNVKDAVDAATGPLEDLNIKKREIPELLKTAAQDPYARPAKLRCAAVRDEIAQLDELLGPDMEAKAVEVASADDGFLGITDVKIPTQDQVEDGVGNLARKTVMGAISSQVNIIPFRSIVRTITGANRHTKRVTEAYEAGKLRRAYLKGFAQERFGKQCLSYVKPITVDKDAAATDDAKAAE